MAAARATDASAHLVVLLGGEAGLRCGEMMALEWSDVDLGKRQLCVQRSDWRGHVTATEGGRLRYVPLTLRLAAALRDHRHLRDSRVLCQTDGSPVTQKIVQDHVRRSARRAQLAKSGVHRLRYLLFTPLDAGSAGARFRSWPGIWTSPRRNGTCTSVRRPLMARFACLDRAGAREGF